MRAAVSTQHAQPWVICTSPARGAQQAARVPKPLNSLHNPGCLQATRTLQRASGTSGTPPPRWHAWRETWAPFARCASRRVRAGGVPMHAGLGAGSACALLRMRGHCTLCANQCQILCPSKHPAPCTSASSLIAWCMPHVGRPVVCVCDLTTDACAGAWHSKRRLLRLACLRNHNGLCIGLCSACTPALLLCAKVQAGVMTSKCGIARERACASTGIPQACRSTPAAHILCCCLCARCADGKFLAAAEPADFVHVYDAASGFRRAQLVG